MKWYSQWHDRRDEVDPARLWSVTDGETTYYCHDSTAADALVSKLNINADLLAACERAKSLLESQLANTYRCGDPEYECPMHDAHKDNDEHQVVLAAIEAAIAKARGSDAPNDKPPA